MTLKSTSLTAVSLFAGAGGCCAGVKAAGFQIQVAVEMDQDACKTFAANAPEVPIFAGSIRYFGGRHAAAHRRRYGLDAVDLVFGGPPCQPFSTIGARDASDPRRAAWGQFVRVVDELRPKAIMFENVPGLLQADQGRLAEAILDRFRASGYGNALVLTLDAADFGVPQARRRIFVVATRDDVPLPGKLADIMKASLHSAHRPRVSVQEAIGDLPEAVWPSGHEMMPYGSPAASAYARAMRRGSPGLTGHHTKDVRDGRRRHIIAALAPGADGSSLPEELFAEGAALLTRRKWKRLHPHRPSHTLLANMHIDLASWVHPIHDRFISLREAARLMGFPDSFVFPVSETESLRQVGNAVPSALAQAVAGALVEALGGVPEVRRRGRPPKGERALSGVERRREWRQRHRVETLELPGAVMARIRAEAERTGQTMAEVVAAAMGQG